MQTGQVKATLSEPQRRLVEVMQTLNFGRIEQLAICSGHPMFDPPPRVIREIKIGGENGPRPERDAGNFRLKDQVVELFQHLAQLGDGTVAVLEVKHGLPFRLLVAATAV